jgi:predicted dehydrogenase
MGVAKIAAVKVIPAMQRGQWTEVTAIASRDAERARQAAARLGIPTSYGSYEDLLGDPAIDAVYIPLPNHLHVPWTRRAAEAGKHVLCEKPIGMNAAEAEQLLAVRNRTGVRIQEAFMVRTHPQWIAVRELVRGGTIGQLRTLSGFFSYFNEDPDNVRNRREYGGGGLLDIGCYLINIARMVFEREPQHVFGATHIDPRFGVDTLTSMLLDFGAGHAIGTCSTQLVPYQRVHIMGTKGRIEVEIPFNAPPDEACRVFVDEGRDLRGESAKQVDLAVCDQYTIQADLFSRAILDNTPAPYPLEDSVANMRVVDAVFAAAGARPT